MVHIATKQISQTNIFIMSPQPYHNHNSGLSGILSSIHSWIIFNLEIIVIYIEIYC